MFYPNLHASTNKQVFLKKNDHVDYVEASKGNGQILFFLVL